MTSETVVWLIGAFIALGLVILIVEIIRTWVLPWYRKRQENSYDDILRDDLIEDDISIVLAGTVTQKDLKKTIKLLKEVSVAAKRTGQKAMALEKIKERQVKIEEGKKKIEQLITEIKSTSQQP